MKINFTGVCPVSSERIAQNEQHARSLGFPFIGEAKTPRLAIVGGGPSIMDTMEEIRHFDGDVWAINGAWKWCDQRSIHASFFSVDPRKIVHNLCIGAHKAMLSMGCDPSVFAVLRDSDVLAVETKDVFGPTTATAAPLLAINRGYKEVTFFGCESSYSAISHAYGGAENDFNYIRAVCAGQEFLTAPCMMMQAEFLSEVIRAAPHVFKERSGGLLGACVRPPEIDVIAVSRKMYDTLKFVSAA